jgi:hypothetical protein
LPSPLACIHRLVGLSACTAALLSGTAQAQQAGVFSYRWNDTPPNEVIRPADIREALVWTGQLDGVFKGQLDDAVRRASQSWQKSRSYAPTDKLSDAQAGELVLQALKEREAVGWSMLRDPAVGFSIGFPSKFVTFSMHPRFDGNALLYQGSGSIRQSVEVDYGRPNCRSLPDIYPKVTAGATYRARQDNWLVALFRHADATRYLKVVCHGTGAIATEMTIPSDLLPKHPGLFGAMAGGLAMMHVPDPTVTPRPQVDDLPLAPSDVSDERVVRPQPKARPQKPSDIDDAGKTSALRLETRDGPDLRADEIFEKVSGAVYVVKADHSLGSGVAISDSELLTNCHVVGSQAEVRITHAKAEMPAKVVSRNADADRCVLRTAGKLPVWVSVRPYDDIKVGERAITIGTPQGLELTAAEGIVSSKRFYNQSRVVQTSAPISQGSSGGGLFDARGHLLGITTFYFRGGQNLNFAVAAEEFAREPEESANR